MSEKRWKYAHDFGYSEVTCDGQKIAETYGEGRRTNAVLIASAPEMADRIAKLEAALLNVAERAESGGDPIYHLLADCRNIAREALGRGE